MSNATFQGTSRLLLLTLSAAFVAAAAWAYAAPVDVVVSAIGKVAETVNQLAGRVTVLFITHKVPSNLKVSSHLRLGTDTPRAAA